ncbi:MAG: 2-oxo acid dehydrogenase subunit E2 [Clostridia bacterium]|nr:2-oxo acid dehydrogenase subunit E2 [Clostridia bacterium]
MAKRRWGDRIDGRWVRDIDPMHYFTPYLYPNRADNEAVVHEEIDLTSLNAFLEEKNRGLTEDKYTLLHAIGAALVRVLTLRPKLNYFIQGSRLYERNHISLAFVVKKKFSDGGGEALAFKKFGPETTIDSLHEAIIQEINACRSEKLDNSTQGMEFFSHFPRWLMRIAMGILRLLDYYGKVPQLLVKADPDYASVFISNLGSIRLNANYHHLSNWGTCSIFLVIGEKHMAPVFREDGSYEMHEMLPLSVTLDERIADGYYYSRSIRLLKHLLQHPELLNEEARKEVEL